MLKVIRRHTLDAIFPVMRIVLNYRKGQKQLTKIAKHLESTLAYLRRSKPRKALGCLSRHKSAHHQAQFTFIAQPDIKSLEESTKVKKT